MIRDVLEAEYGGQLARRCRRPGAETGTRLLIRFRERDMRRQAWSAWSVPLGLFRNVRKADRGMVSRRTKTQTITVFI